MSKKIDVIIFIILTIIFVRKRKVNMKTKYYAVKKGKNIGIYTDWEECQSNVIGISGAIFKSFHSLKEAEDFINENNIAVSSKTNNKNYAFVDGSYNIKTNTYGFGGFVIANGKKILLSGSDNEPEMATMRNVAGEVLGCMAAIQAALAEGLKELTIYYDYKGIEMWATGQWKRKKAGTIAYYKYMQSVKDEINIKFVHVKGHTGVAGNEEADKMAKKAVGIL